MIPKAHIDEWRTRVPWSQDAWVEQDLVICRVIVEMFRASDLEGRSVSRAQLEANLHGKASDPGFRGDTVPLLRPGLAWDFDAAMDDVLQSLVARLPGEPWRGEGPA